MHLELGDAVGGDDGLELVGLQGGERRRLNGRHDRELAHRHHQPRWYLARAVG